MKKNFIFLLTVLIGLSAKSQISSNFLSGSHFVNGMRNVYDTITVVSDPNSPSDYVSIYVSNSSHTMIYDSLMSSTIIGTKWVLGVDTLNPAAEVIYAVFSSSGTRTTTPDIHLTIVPKPDWLKVNNSKATVSTTDTTNKKFIVGCLLPLYNKTKTISDSVKLLGGAEFGVNNQLTFQCEWDYANGMVLQTTNQDYNYSFIALNSTVYSESLLNSTGISLTTYLDPSFNLRVYANYKKTKTLLDKNTPSYAMPTPIPGLVVNLSAGIKIDGEIGGSILFGKDATSGNYGFIRSADTVSNFAIGGAIDGKVNGSLALVSNFIANVRGSLVASGKVGISYNYQTEPNGFQDTVKLGGSFQLQGSITTDNIARKLWKYFTNEPQESKVLYQGCIWPDTSCNAFLFGDGYPKALARQVNTTSVSSTYMSNWYFDIPTYGAQPDISTRGNDMAVVWMEADTNQQYLKFSKYDTLTSCFTGEKIVITNHNSISDPKVSILKGGDAIITWTQNTYNETNLPSNITFDQMIAAQNIWFAIYDHSTDNIVYSAPLSDTTSTSADGQATVSAGKGNDAMITWVSKPQSAPDADIYYVNISKSGSTWLGTSPAVIPNLPTGANYSVKVAYADTVNATALWINDPDNNDTTFNNSIVAAQWDGTQWLTPSVIIPASPNVNFNELDVDFNEVYGALVYTYEYYDTTTSVLSSNVDVKLYNNNTDTWLSSQDFTYSDTLNVFKIPRISVDETGLSTVIFQSQPLYTDSAIFEQGKLLVFSKDMSMGGSWFQAGNTVAINDTNHIVSFISSGFSSNKDIFVLTQESDTIVGNNYINTGGNGILFGDSTLGLVLRVAQIDNNHNLVNLPEPSCVPTGIKDNNSKINTEPVNVRNYPNPAKEYTIFEYFVNAKSQVKIEVMDLQGQIIDVPISTQLAEGTYKTIYNTTNLTGGVYLYKIIIGNNSMVKKLIIVK